MARNCIIGLFSPSIYNVFDDLIMCKTLFKMFCVLLYMQLQVDIGMGVNGGGLAMDYPIIIIHTMIRPWAWLAKNWMGNGVFAR